MQVEYLLENGADVNRGLKSSSLHYATCFCRPSIVKVSLNLMGYFKISVHIHVQYAPEHIKP